MPLVSDLEGGVQDRLEEARGADHFWSRQFEIRPLLVEAMSMATLISGEPEIRQTVVTNLAANNNVFPTPANAVAMLKIEGPNGLVIKKETLWSLSQMVPTWETETGPLPKNWFPIGLTQFGLYPKLTAQVQVIISYVGLPVPVPASPIAYTGNENIPFQVEYLEAFEEYAAAMARMKEATQEFLDGLKEFDRFLSRTWELSKFATRKGSLRFTRSKGVAAKVTEVTMR